jgi:CheY-like chemotaxis protein
MPKMGGLTLAQVLRERDPTIKILVFTGYPLKLEVEKALAHCIVDWLQKPLSLEELAQAVSRVLKPAVPEKQ